MQWRTGWLGVVLAAVVTGSAAADLNVPLMVVERDGVNRSMNPTTGPAARRSWPTATLTSSPVTGTTGCERRRPSG